MLSPTYLDHCADGVIELYQRLDESIARDIARRLMKMGEITDTARWQAEQLQHAGLLFEDVIAEVAKYSSATEIAVRRAFEDAGVQSVDAEIEQYFRAGITVPPIRQSERAWNILQAALRKTNGELHNLTLTTAVETQQRFISACTLAEMQVSSGMLDYQTAIRRAVQDASGAGASVLYPSGHIDKLDVAVRRALLTGVNQTCGRISLTLAEEFGCDLMEITAHAGARPEHAVWQGKIVSLSGRRGYLTLSDIGYGTGAGFMGWNCRHSWNPFFEGISEPNYTPDQIEKLNARDIEYNGQKYTEYEISQMQRKMEREIRATKRELTAFDAAGLQEDFARQSVKLKAQEQKLKNFTRATDRRVDSARVQVQGFGHSQASKAVWENKKERLRQKNNRAILKTVIADKRISLVINVEKQNRHILGAKEYIDGRSYLTISLEEAQALVNRLHATGTVYIANDGKQIREVVSCGKTIGVTLSKNTKVRRNTDRVTIHYSKTGTHIVPAKPGGTTHD